MQNNDNIGHIMADDKGQTGLAGVEEMLSIGEAADQIGVSVDTLRRWSKKGRVMTYRSPGGHRYYKRKDLSDLFDAKYTRDEPTIRSSSEKDQDEGKSGSEDQKEAEIAEQPQHSKDQSEQTKQSLDMVIPQMQPVQVISLDRNDPGLPMPGLSTPPPPMPQSFDQPQFRIDIQSPIAKPPQQGMQQNYRQPAPPIGEKRSSNGNGMSTPMNATIISDYTTGGGFAEERQPEELTHTRNVDIPTSDPKPAEQPRQPTPYHSDQQQPSTAEDVDKKIVDDQEPTETTPSPDTTEIQVPEDDQDIQLSQPAETSQQIRNEDSEKPDVKIESVTKTEERSITQDKEAKMEYIEPQLDQTEDTEEEIAEEITVTDVVQKKESIVQVTRSEKVESEASPEMKSESSAQTEPIDRPNEETKKKKQKKSILEPEGIDASKLNNIEKMEDEGWLSRNKTNILIGFTVFLLIDIILFIIWLTTSRILSPIP